MCRKFFGIAEQLTKQNSENRSPLFSCNFILPKEGNKTPDPVGDAYLDVLSASLTGKTGFALMKNQDADHVQYLKGIGFAFPENLIFTGKNEQQQYPFGSAEAAFLNFSTQEIEKMRRKFQDIAFFPNFISSDALQIAQKLEIPFGNIATSVQENAQEISAISHSKSFLRSKAQEFGYDIAPGKTIEPKGEIIDFASFKKIILELQGEVKESYNLSNQELQEVEYWLKFDSLSGGDGTINIKSPLTDESINNALNSVKNIAKKCGMSLENFPMPLVLEAGANSIPGKKIIGNINSQALIGNGDDIRMLDTSLQQTTENGDYIGNTLPFMDANALKAIEESYVKVCKAFQDLGYRGMIGGDAIVSESENGFLVEWFDLNPRINGSQAFQEQYRALQSEHPSLFGINVNLTFPQGVNFSEVRAKLERLLFSPETLGVLPVALRTNDGGKNSVVKCSVFENSPENLQETLNMIRELGIKI